VIANFQKLSIRAQGEFLEFVKEREKENPN